MAIGAALSLVGSVIVSCGSSVTCGSGTTKKGDTCVAVAAGGSGGADSGTGDSAPSGPLVNFDGVTSVAPVTDSSLQITWQPATAQLSPANTIVYKVYVATTAGKENFSTATLASPPGANSVVVGGLQSMTNYFVVVRAEDQQGNQDAPDKPVEMSGMTQIDTMPPTFAGATAAKAVKGSGNSVTVSWDPAMDDLTPPAGITYEVFWSDSSSKGSLPSTFGVVSDPGASSVVVPRLPKPMSDYSFHVIARDAAGNQDANTVVQTGSTGPDVTAPTFGGCTAVSNPGAANATLTWDVATDDTSTADHITYNLYAVTDPVDQMTQFNLPNNSYTGVSSGQITGLSPTTTYYFVCRAADEAGNEDTNISYRIATTLADAKPPQFKGITNTNVEATSVTLTWDAATDNETDSTEIQYTVYQGTDPDPFHNGEAINPGPELGATSISIGNLNSNTTYFWAVVATDSAGNSSSPSDDVSGTTLVSFENDVQPIFSANCAKTGCHGSNNPMQGQDLSDGNAYANIVGVPTRFPTDQNPHQYFDCKHMNRIEPGDVNRSFILYKLGHSKELTGDTACTAAQLAVPFGNPVPQDGCCTCGTCLFNDWNFGLGMPKDLCISDPTCPALDDSIVSVIKTWVTQGALDN
jgi:hypothetical protein